MTIAGGGGGLLGVERRVDHMGGHREGHVGEHAEGREIVPLQLLPRRLDHRQRQVAVGAGPAVAGHVLDHRQHAAGEKPLGGGAAEDRHLAGRPAVGPVADDVVGARRRERRAPAGNPR